MDPKVEWALTDFQLANIGVIFILDQTRTEYHGSFTASQEENCIFQGEVLKFYLVITAPKIPSEQDIDLPNFKIRWEEFGDELDVEVRICPNFMGRVKESDKAALDRLVAGTDAEHQPRTRTALMRRACKAKKTSREVPEDVKQGLAMQLAVNKLIGDHQDSGTTENKHEDPNHLDDFVASYCIEVPVKVPSRFLDRPLALEVSISAQAYPTHHPQPASHPSLGGLEAEVERVFQMSRVAPDALPSRTVDASIRIVQPLKLVTLQTHSVFPQAALLSIQVENTHPVAVVTLHNLDLHLGNTTRGHRGKNSTSEVTVFSNKPRGPNAPSLLPHGSPDPKLKKFPSGVLTPPTLLQQTSLDGMDPVKVGSENDIDLVGLFHVCWLNSDKFPLELEAGDKFNFLAKVSLVPDQQEAVREKIHGLKSLCTPLTATWSAGAVSTNSIHSVVWVPPSTAQGNLVLQITGPETPPALNSVVTLRLLVKNWTNEIRSLSLSVGDQMDPPSTTPPRDQPSGAWPPAPPAAQPGTPDFVALETHMNLGVLAPGQEKLQELHIIPLVKGTIKIDCCNIWDMSYQQLLYPEHPFHLSVS
mmetsp:Transcript_2767/g.3934  ORF Transcript_2767/g.3934 Transcript_2767/m.3934 type:complete len:587 (-) Transcript_2767:118-1878(-)